MIPRMLRKVRAMAVMLSLRMHTVTLTALLDLYYLVTVRLPLRLAIPTNLIRSSSGHWL